MDAKIAITIAVILSACLVAGAGVAYAYQTTYTEDTSQEASIVPKYISLEKTDQPFAVPQDIVLRYSTVNVTPGMDDHTIDTTHAIDVRTADSDPIQFALTGGVWIASDEGHKRAYILSFNDSGALESAEAVFYMGCYSVTHSGSDEAITVTASLAENEDPEDVVTLTLSSTDTYAGGESCTTDGGNVYVYAHVDIMSGITPDGEYGTATVPPMTVTLTAVPEVLP